MNVATDIHLLQDHGQDHSTNFCQYRHTLVVCNFARSMPFVDEEDLTGGE